MGAMPLYVWNALSLQIGMSVGCDGSTAYERGVMADRWSEGVCVWVIDSTLRTSGCGIMESIDFAT